MIAFDVVRNFESTVAKYAGSKYAASVDSCSNAIFLSLLYRNIKGKEITIPSRTYPSVPCAIINAGGKVKFTDQTWKGIYTLDPVGVVDGAKRFTKNMYVKDTLHCLSFHSKKHLKIGRGGMVLTDDEDAYLWLKKARFDGRSECPLSEDDFQMIGWNFYMSPEQAARGLWLMGSMPDDNEDLQEVPDYPDLSKFPIFTKD